MVSLKIGDKVTTKGDSCEFVITELPGCSSYFPSNYRGVDPEDGNFGLIDPDDIETVNGESVMTIDTKRLATDAAYWDECGAPEDAEYYSPDSDDYFEGWLRSNPDKTRKGMQFKHIGSGKWINGSSVDDNCIPRPQAPEAEWVDGLPGVGTRCMGKPDGYKEPVEGVVIWHTEKPDSHPFPDFFHDAIFLVDRGRPEYCSKFEPIPTPKQRQREELMELARESYLKGAADHAGGLADVVDAILSRYNLEPKP